MEVQKGILIMTSSQLYYLLLFSLGIEFMCNFFRLVVESAGNCAKILSDCLQILRRMYSFFRNEMKGLSSNFNTSEKWSKSGRQITSSKHIVAQLAEYITPVYQADTMLPNKKYCIEVCYESCFYLFGRRVSGYQLLSQLSHYVFT